MRGLLLAFEGLDRCGKTTQARLLKQYFDPHSPLELVQKAQLLRFPERNSKTGKEIDEYLKNKSECTDQRIHELFSLNRWEYKDLILQNVNSGIHTIVDRYAFSGVAYSAAKGLDIEWCKTHDKGLPKPDIIFYIDVTEEDVARRAGFGDERFEKKDFQKKVREAYEKLFDEDWQMISGLQSIEEIHQDVLKKIEVYLKKRRSPPYNGMAGVKELWNVTL